MKHLQPGTRIAGCAVPVFSLRTRGSFGTGDFGDLKQMVTWVAQTGQKILQILPINDTTSSGTWVDSYPYSAISIYALHPMYADLRQLPPLKDSGQAAHFATLQAQLNALPQVDYEAVNQAKHQYLQLLYKQEFGRVKRTKAYKSFIADTIFWLDSYVQYSVRRDQRINPDQPAPQADYYRYIQYILDTQMRDVHTHAQTLGVMLKGDIPIGVNRYGCDVETDPHYFNMDGQAGAPPDNFSADGQNWGFPTYNWEAMLRNGGQWWIQRFRNMARYFDAYRIDHVLGFFRIWEIPSHAVGGMLGQFQPSLALSIDDIHSYGLWLDEQFMTTPFIADWVIDRIFGSRAQEVKDTYLQHQHDDIWSLRPQYDTERKVQALSLDAQLTSGLYSLIRNVLFLRDHKNPNLYHPRIAVQQATVYETLWQHDKDNFNRLYDDYFYRRNNQFWYEEAMKKLPMLCDATEMLVCAEDLGMVPDCVSWVMNQLQILSLELISMPKDPSVRWGILDRNPWLSVCTISSHDSATMRMWWDEDPAQTQDFYNQYLGYQGPAPHPMPSNIAQDMVMRHLRCPSALCILTLQDWLAINQTLRHPDPSVERINIPSNPRHYWRYRMHINIEDLMNSIEFNEQISGMIIESGR